jgi:hypothetical protein
MSLKKIAVIGFAVLSFCSFAQAAGWVSNQTVTNMWVGGSDVYGGANGRAFIELSSYPGKLFSVYLDDEGRKAIYTTAITALLNKKKVDVYYTSTSITGDTPINRIVIRGQ